MSARLDHVVVAVPDLTAGVDLFRELGFSVQNGGRHVGRGTANAIVHLDRSFVEILSVQDEAAELAGAGRRGRALVDFIKSGGGLVGYAVTGISAAALMERSKAIGHPAPEIAMVQRRRPNGTLLKWRVAWPAGIQWRRLWPFVVEPMGPVDTAQPGNHATSATRISDVAVSVNDGVAASAWYAGCLNLDGSMGEPLPELGAERIRLTSRGALSVNLVSPTADGPVFRELQRVGEGPFEIVLAVTHLSVAERYLSRAGATLAEAPGYRDGLLVVPSGLPGLRIVFREDD